MQQYDVLIIGGGPTGLSTGISVAKAGLNAVIVEEHPKIGHPLACGEGLSIDKMRTVENMPKYNSEETYDDFIINRKNYLIERILSTQRFFFGTSGVATSQLETVTINRPLFDHLMAKEAQKNGVDLSLQSRVNEVKRDGNSVIVKTTSQTYRANLVIGCDGPSAHSVKMIGLKGPSEYVQGVEFNIKGILTDALDFYFDFNRFPKMHYGWVFPKKSSTNIGIVVDPASNPNTILKKFMDLHFNDVTEEDIIQKIAGIIPASGPIPNLCTDNYMVAGDAAGLTNSIFYGGIAIGIHSGWLAAQTAIEACKSKNFSKKKLLEYEYKCRMMPYADPIIQKAHQILYSDFTAYDLENFGSLINGWDITRMNIWKKLLLSFKALSKPSMIKKFWNARIIAYGFSKSRDWGF
ncbi:NAD(P)/FAD-dependent oxidoreductase [Candidatus Hodarchaeum mangrovi]